MANIWDDHKSFKFYEDVPTIDPKSPRSMRVRQSVNYNEDALTSSLKRPSLRNKTPTRSPGRSQKPKTNTPNKTGFSKVRKNLFNTTNDDNMEAEDVPDAESSSGSEDGDDHSITMSDIENCTPPKRRRSISRTPIKRSQSGPRTPSKNGKSPSKSTSNSPKSPGTPRRRFATLHNNMQSLKLDNSPQVESSGLYKARQHLWQDNVPHQMKHRDEEIRQLRDFCHIAIQPHSISSAMYLGGAPGTGKTSCVLQVIAQMQSRKQTKSKFTFVHLNAGQMIRPEEVYVHFYKALCPEVKGVRVSQQNARRKLNSMLAVEDRDRLPIILLVDELDLLLSKKQSVLYDIFNWCAMPESRVNVVAISNTFDLPQRALDKRVQSRLGLNMIHFHPYDFKQIEEIISDRLQNCGGRIHPDAFKLCSRKVANMSGDIRKALDIIRRAIDVAIEADQDELRFEHVNQAMTEAGDTYRMQLVRSFNSDELRIFRAVVKDLKDCGLEQTTFYRVFKSYKVACVADGEEPLSCWDALDIVKLGCSINFYTMSKGQAMMNRQMALGFSNYEAEFCLRQLEKRTT